MPPENPLPSFANVRLNTPRLVVREWTTGANDENDLLAIESCPEVVHFLDKKVHDRAAVQTRLRSIRQARNAQPRLLYEWAVELQATGRAIGGCVLGVEDQVNMVGQMAYYLHPDYWGQGYASEAARALLRFGFEAICLQRIRALCDPDNTSSLLLLHAIGMRQTAVFHEVKGEARERLQYALEESAWSGSLGTTLR